MKLWIDAQLSPALARWVSERFEGVEVIAVRDLGLRDAEDEQIFEAARQAGAAVMSKDSDFAELVRRHGPPSRCFGLPVETPPTRRCGPFCRRRCQRP